MLRLSLNLAVGGGREALTRLAAIAAGVMIGVVLLLSVLSGLHTYQASSQKVCWQCTGRLQVEPQARNKVKQYPLLWKATTDYYRGRTIQRVDLAVRAPSDSNIPGIPHLPKDGEYYASPALAHLLDTAPASQLGNRFPGKRVGQIGSAGLSAPDALVIVIGRSEASLIQEGYTNFASGVNTSPDTQTLGPVLWALFIIAVGGLLFAVITLIGTSTRLAAARREEKLATLRLLGATPRQINRFAAVDAAVSAGMGALGGLVLFYALRPVLANSVAAHIISFFPGDFTPTLAAVLAVLLGAPCLAALAAIVSLRRVRISPLGVARRIRPRPPTSWRIGLFLLGLVVVGFVWWHNRNIVPTDVRGHLVPYFVIGFGLVLVGLVVAGPWLTMVLNRMIARYAGRASLLLASRRLTDNPKAAFRPVSVMIVAVFLCTMIAAVAPTLLRQAEYQNKGANNILRATQYLSLGRTIPADITRNLQTVLQTIPGVQVVPILVPAGQGLESVSTVMISCNDAAKLKIFGHCKTGATVLQKQAGFESNDVMDSFAQAPVSLHVDTALLQSLPVYGFIVVTDGQPAHIEQLRTLLAQHPHYFSTGRTWGEESAARVKLLSSAQLGINGGLLLVLFVAGCSLAVAGAGGLIERKRPFGLLRVAGMSLGQLVCVVLYESIAPLVLATLLAIGSALLLVRILLSAFGDRPTVIPHLAAGYWGLLGAGMLLALLMLLATLPILAVTTRPSQVRFE